MVTANSHLQSFESLSWRMQEDMNLFDQDFKADRHRGLALGIESQDPEYFQILTAGGYWEIFPKKNL